MYQLWFMANDLGLQGLDARAVPLYDLIIGDLVGKADVARAMVIRLKLAENLQNAGEADQAKDEIMNEILEARVENADLVRLVWDRAAFMLVQMKFYDEAVIVYNKLLTFLGEKDPQNKKAQRDIMIKKAETFERQNDFKKAANAYQKALNHEALDASSQASVLGKVAGLLAKSAGDYKGDIKKAALAYLDSAKAQRMIGNYGGSIADYLEFAVLWDKAKYNFNTGEVISAVNSLLKVATYLKQGSSLFRSIEQRKPHMELFDLAIQTIEHIGGFGYEFDEDQKSRLAELKKQRDVWDTNKVIPGESNTGEFLSVLQRIGLKLGLDREELLGRWLQHGKVMDVDYVAADSYLGTFFDYPQILTGKFWLEAKKLLGYLQLSEDQIEQFNIGHAGDENEQRLDQLQARIELDPEPATLADSSLLDEKPFYFPNAQLVAAHLMPTLMTGPGVLGR